MCTQARNATVTQTRLVTKVRPTSGIVDVKVTDDVKVCKVLCCISCMMIVGQCWKFRVQLASQLKDVDTFTEWVLAHSADHTNEELALQKTCKITIF